MWGTHVEGVISEASDSAKTQQQAQQKVQMALRRVMHGEIRGLDDSETSEPSATPSKFRDPVSLIGKKKKESLS